MRGQVANEFIILMGVAIMMMMIFLASVAKDMSDMSSEREANVLRDVGLSVQKELFNAAGVKDGYLRTFEVPISYRGIQYNVTIVNGYLVLTSQTSGLVQEVALPEVTGQIRMGLNLINKTGGVIHLN